MNYLINELILERKRQNAKWGEQNHAPEWWMQILMEEVGEASKAILESKFGNQLLIPYREELLQIAAVAIAAIESFDRNMEEPTQ